MDLTRRSGVDDVAACVAGALARAGIRAILTGGACASIYTEGAYKSADLDFVLQSSVSQSRLDEAMAGAGFHRKGNQYFHPRARFYVEFPPGPLAIGGDYRIEPIERRVHHLKILTLSPTDSCRDRLVAFLHWADQQSLETAIQIAVRNDVDLESMRSWCEREGALKGFEQFVRELERIRRRRAKRAATRRPRGS